MLFGGLNSNGIPQRHREPSHKYTGFLIDIEKEFTDTIFFPLSSRVNRRHFVFPLWEQIWVLGFSVASASMLPPISSVCQEENDIVPVGERHGTVFRHGPLFFSMDFRTFYRFTPKISLHGGKTKWRACAISCSISMS